MTIERDITSNSLGTYTDSFIQSFIHSFMHALPHYHHSFAIKRRYAANKNNPTNPVPTNNQEEQQQQEPFFLLFQINHIVSPYVCVCVCVCDSLLFPCFHCLCSFLPIKYPCLERIHGVGIGVCSSVNIEKVLL